MLDEALEQARAAATVMLGFDRPWCIAGGWAIDLAVGRATREHADVEIAIYRPHQLDLREYLADWDFQVTTEGRRCPWPAGQWVDLPDHEFHATSPQHVDLAFLLNECDAIDWIYRRDPRIRRALEQTIARGVDGIPILAPEIVLLYKSKDPRPQDELDFRVARELLDDEARRWLIESLNITTPQHPWIELL